MCHSSQVEFDVGVRSGNTRCEMDSYRSDRPPASSDESGYTNLHDDTSTLLFGKFMNLLTWIVRALFYRAVRQLRFHLSAFNCAVHCQ